MNWVTLYSSTWIFLGNYTYQFPMSFKHGYLLQIKFYRSFPAILSRMLLAKANLVIHLLAILSRMALAEANLVNTLDFIYIEHDIIVIAFTRKTLNCTSAKRREKPRTYSACLVTSSNRRSNYGLSHVSDSLSHVSSLICKLHHKTLTIRIFLLRSSFSP